MFHGWSRRSNNSRAPPPSSSAPPPPTEREKLLSKLEGYLSLAVDFIERGKAKVGTGEGEKYRVKALEVTREALRLPLDGTDAVSARAKPMRARLVQLEKDLQTSSNWAGRVNGGGGGGVRGGMRGGGGGTPSASTGTRANRTTPGRGHSVSSEGGKGGSTNARAMPSAPTPTSSSSPAPPASGVNAQLRANIESEILDGSPGVQWEDLAGLAGVKQSLKELVILPTLRADLFTGLRAPARGLLLFGPPGNGKTMLAKAVATEAQCTFFNISASSLTSKWVGEGEKLVRTLFTVAYERAPSIIFIDEIDSLLSARKADENEASRRMKTEFLVQMDGVSSGNGRLMVLGATNRPDELDDAVLRRLVKRIYIPLPDNDGRRQLLQGMLKGGKEGKASGVKYKLSAKDTEEVVAATKGYSASDLRALCAEAAMGPIRDLSPSRISSVSASQVRPIDIGDFKKAVKGIRPSTNTEQLQELKDWAKKYGAVA